MFQERAQLIQSYDVGSGGRFRLQELALGDVLEFPERHGPVRIRPRARHCSSTTSICRPSWSMAGSAAWPISLLLLSTLVVGLRTAFVRTPWQPYLIAPTPPSSAKSREGFVIDTDHWRHFFLLLGMIWGLGRGDVQSHRGRPCRRRRDGLAMSALESAARIAHRRGPAPYAGCGSACRRIRARNCCSLSRLLAPLPDADARRIPLGIAGLFSTASGLGEGARLAYAALDAAGYAPARLRPQRRLRRRAICRVRRIAARFARRAAA